MEDAAGKFYLWLVKFSTLNELVEYYHTESISRTETIMLRAEPRLFKVRAHYDFNAREPDELEFNKGDTITVLEQLGDWWLGQINSRQGQFPATYVTQISAWLVITNQRDHLIKHFILFFFKYIHANHFHLLTIKSLALFNY